MPLDREQARLRILRGALDKKHRYRRYRLVTMGMTLAILFAVPLFGVARVDLWGGDHWALGKPVVLAKGLAAAIVAIASFYIATFLVNIPAGRMFCGFGCPVGQLSRFADAIDARARDRGRRRRAWLTLVSFAGALSLATVTWWVSPRVFVSGDWRAAAIALGASVALAAAAILHARRWRWSFCRKACPIGLYYSVVQTTPLVEIDYDSAAPCTDCRACETICPVQLDPRQLDAPLPSPGGLAFADLPAANHCLHCGACVEICEHQTRKSPGHPPMGFRRPRPHPAAAHP